MGNSGVFRWMRNSPPKPAANGHRRRQNASPAAENRHRHRQNASPAAANRHGRTDTATFAANRHRARENASPPAASRRRRRQDSPLPANRRRRVNEEDSGAERRRRIDEEDSGAERRRPIDAEDTEPKSFCGACSKSKNCKGCPLTTYFPPWERDNFERINRRVPISTIRQVASEFRTPAVVMQRLEELVEAVDLDKTKAILKMKKENAAIKGENDNLRKLLEESNKNMIHYLSGSIQTGAGMPYQAPQKQYEAPQMDYAYQPAQSSQMHYGYQLPMQYQPPPAQQMPPHQPPQMRPHQMPTYHAPHN